MLLNLCWQVGVQHRVGHKINEVPNDSSRIHTKTYMIACLFKENHKQQKMPFDQKTKGKNKTLGLYLALEMFDVLPSRETG